MSFACFTAFLTLLLHPFYLLIFRTSIFFSSPRDDYAPFLLWLLGAPGGLPAQSPYGYRVLSILAAAPFYTLLPPLALTNLPNGLGAEYVRATAAIAMASYIALVASGVLAYRLSRDRFRLGTAASLFSALFIYVVQLYAAPFGIDPIAILIVILALYWIDRVPVFCAILIVSVAFNEKIAIMFAIWLTIRCMSGRDARLVLGRQWVGAIAAVLVYVAMVAVVRLPGHGEQLEPTAYLPTLMQNLAASITPRGIMFNILPCLLLVVPVWWSWRSIGRQDERIYAPRDLLIVPALACLALAVTQFYQVGRVVMHGAPLFIFPLSRAFELWTRGNAPQYGA